MTKKYRSGNSGSTRYAPVLTPLAAAVLTAIYPAAPLMAQDDEERSEDGQIEEVVVTGSRIRSDTFSSAAPMEVVLTESAEVRGISDLSALLQSTTVAAGSPQITPAISAGVLRGASVVNGGLGTSTLSLRGLGANRTLVLLNGRRVGPSGVQGAISAFDLNTIPLSAIERVEILKDGASSIYGSDAIAGVVNIITRKDEGGDFSAFYSQPYQSGGEQFRVSGSWGVQTDRAYFRATADYNRQEMLRRSQRDYLDCAEDYVFDPATGSRADLIDPRTGEYRCNGSPWGHVWVYDYAAEVGDGTTNVGPPSFLLQYDYDGELSANGVPPLAPAGSNPNWMTTPPGWFPVGRGDPLTEAMINYYNPLRAGTTVVPKSDVATVLLEGEYDFSESMTAYSEFLLSRRESEDVGYRQIWTYIYNYDSADIGNPSDPFSVGWTGAQYLSPLTITNHASQRVTVDYIRVVAGLRGEVDTVLPGWNWDASFQYSRSDGEYQIDQILEDALKTQEFRTSSCEGEVTPISNRPCMDIQWLDPEFLTGDIPQEVKNYLFATDTGTTEYTLWSAEAYMSGEVMELPAGPAAVAFGIHYQEEEILDTPGAISLAGNAWLNSSAGITAGNDTTAAAFGEVNVPLFADLPLVDSLSFRGSARYTDVESYGSGTTYKVGLNWNLTDTFRLRGTYGTSFRAPDLYELYLADQTSFSASGRGADPCFLWGQALADGAISQHIADNCAADAVPPDYHSAVLIAVVTGGGLGVLEAETSTALTAGFVWQPQYVDMAVSVDYFDIDVEDEVSVIGPRNIVYGCYDSDFFPDEPLCDLFSRLPPGAPGLPHSITEIRDSYINIATQRNRGIDLAIRYNQELPGSWGTLTVDTRHTFQLEDTFGVFVDTVEARVGEAGHPEWVGNLNLTLNRDEWSYFWGMRFIGETENYEEYGGSTIEFATGETVDIDLTAEFTMYHRLSVSRLFEAGYDVRLGVANVFNEHPPRMTVFGGTDTAAVGQSAFYSQYGFFGRRYFLNASMSF